MFYKFRFKTFIQALILIVIAITPIFNLGDLMAFWNLSALGKFHLSESSTPIYIKAIKDIIFMLICVTCFYLSLKINKISIYWGGLLLIITYVTPFFLQAFFENRLTALLGLRWIMPVVIVFFLINKIDFPFLRNIARVLNILFFINLSMQIFELFYFPRLFGTILGLNSRNPGIFVIPNTTAFFIITTLFFNYFYESKGALRTIVLGLVPCSLILTASGTGLIVYFFLGITLIFKKLVFLFTPLLIGASALFYKPITLFIETILGRKDLFLTSLGSRTQIFKEISSQNLWVPDLFGYATSAGTLLNQSFNLNNRSMIADSTYGEILGNLGLIGFLFFLFFLFLWTLLLCRKFRLDAICFSIIYIFFAATTSVVSAFPMNLLFSVGLAYFMPLVIPIRKKHEER